MSDDYMIYVRELQVRGFTLFGRHWIECPLWGSNYLMYKVIPSFPLKEKSKMRKKHAP